MEALYSVRTPHTPESDWGGMTSALVPAWDRHPLSARPATLRLMLPLDSPRRLLDIEVDNVSCNSTGWRVRFDGAGWTSYAAESGLAHGVHSIIVAPSGDVWAASAGYGVSRFDGNSWTAFAPADHPALLQNTHAMAADHQGGMWFATDDYDYLGSSELHRFDGQDWKRFTGSDGLLDDYVSAIAVDATGGVWVGSSSGVSRFDGETWTTYTPAEGLAPSDVRLIATNPSGEVWAYGDGGISRFDGQMWRVQATPDALGNGWVASMAVDHRGDVWLATAGDGAWRYTGEEWIHYTQADGLTSNYVTAIGVDTDGGVWFGGNGIVRFDGDNWFRHTTADGVPADTIVAIAPDAVGGAWVGTSSQGAAHFDPSWARPVVVTGTGAGQARFEVNAEGLPVGLYRSQFTITPDPYGEWNADVTRVAPAELRVVERIHLMHLPVVTAQRR